MGKSKKHQKKSTNTYTETHSHTYNCGCDKPKPIVKKECGCNKPKPIVKKECGCKCNCEQLFYEPLPALPVRPPTQFVGTLDWIAPGNVQSCCALSLRTNMY